jgi:hypothetical protein
VRPVPCNYNVIQSVSAFHGGNTGSNPVGDAKPLSQCLRTFRPLVELPQRACFRPVLQFVLESFQPSGIRAGWTWTATEHRSNTKANSPGRERPWRGGVRLFRQPVARNGGAVHRPVALPRRTPFAAAESLAAPVSPFLTKDAFAIGLHRIFGMDNSQVGPIRQ